MYIYYICICLIAFRAQIGRHAFTLHSEKYILNSFQFEWNMIVVRVFLLIMSHTEFRLVYIQRKISHRINSFFIITIAFLSI